MRLIGLVLALGILSPLAAGSQQAGKPQSKDFPGGVVFLERVDEMTDQKRCSVHTKMTGVRAVVSGTTVVFSVHESLGPVVQNPAPMLRLGQGKPVQLTATDRPYLILVPREHARETIEALYTQSKVLVRWSDLRRDQHTKSIEVGDFGAAYDHAVVACGWPRLAVTRGAFASPTPAPQSPAPLPARVTEAVALDAPDFPYAYYLRQISQKIHERWSGRAIPGQQPSVVFEIGRDGRLNGVVIDKSSGNVYYDQAALRVINDAGPFPPLPGEFKESLLRIRFQFSFDPTGG